MLRTVRPLVLQQVPQVLVPETPEQAAASRCKPGELEIDEAGHAVLADEQVRLLGEVVVHDTGTMQPAQQRRRSSEVGRIPGLADLHGHAWKVASRQLVSFRFEQPGHAVDSRHRCEDTRFAPQQQARKPPRPWVR